METELPPQPARTWRLWGITFDARIVQLAVFSTLLLIVEAYNRPIQLEYNQLVLHFVIPLGIIVLLWRESPRTYGLRAGDWRLGLPVALAAIAVMAIIIWFVGHLPTFQTYYTKLVGDRSTARLVIDTGFELLAWEFFCRGWLLFGLGRKYGTDAIWLQAIPFALMHLGKPELETLTTIFGGALFGMLAWRTRSFAYGWLIHWFMVTWMLLVASGRI